MKMSGNTIYKILKHVIIILHYIMTLYIIGLLYISCAVLIRIKQRSVLHSKGRHSTAKL